MCVCVSNLCGILYRHIFTNNIEHKFIHISFSPNVFLSLKEIVLCVIRLNRIWYGWGLVWCCHSRITMSMCMLRRMFLCCSLNTRVYGLTITFYIRSYWTSIELVIKFSYCFGWFNSPLLLFYAILWIYLLWYAKKDAYGEQFERVLPVWKVLFKRINNWNGNTPGIKCFLLMFWMRNYLPKWEILKSKLIGVFNTEFSCIINFFKDTVSFDKLNSFIY